MTYRFSLSLIGTLAGVIFSFVAGAAQVQYPRIYGGSELDTVYPWMVSLQARNNNGVFTHFCGGTLIDPYWILTAAHCVENKSASQVRVMIGDLDLDETSNETTTEIRAVQRIIMNESYGEGFGQDNDIALLRLATPSSNETVPLISREEMDSVAPLTDGLVMGWGRTIEARRSNNLKQVSLPIQSDAECRSVLGEYYNSGVICAGGVENEDSCNGDSGGPLMIDIDGTLKHAGIVSFGVVEACGTAGIYGGYTRVASYLDWIESKLNRVALITWPDFGYTIPYITRSGTLEFVNYSNVEVSLADTRIAGNNPANFVITSNNCETLLPPNAGCAITIQATPTSYDREESATLQITTSSPGTPLLQTELRITTLNPVDTSDVFYSSELSWFTGGDQPWLESNVALDGISAGSGPVDNNQHSVLAVDVSDVNELTVHVKVSSEADFDGLVIFRDGNYYQFFSGELDWTRVTIPAAGIDIIEFVYTKDGSVAAGADGAWIESELLENADNSEAAKNSGSGGGGSLGLFTAATLLTLVARRRKPECKQSGS